MTEAREVIRVELGERSYDVVVGSGLLAQSGSFASPFLKRPRCAIVTDETVASLHLDALNSGLASNGIESDAIVLPPGERTKCWEMLERTVENLLDFKIERDDMLIAFGGGVIGDLAGFAASILRRGIRFIQIPTSLLAQVDSSVGGKTGINSPSGKNLIGAFHQPSLVLADIDVLDTLSGREFLAGYGEVAKYGLLGDLPFFEWLEKNGPALAAGDKTLRSEAVARSVQAKADIVARDEHERGDRALLNLGHTFGHALEAATGYSDRLLHGEGVAVGMGLAFELSSRLGHCSQETPSRVRAHLSTMQMKTRLADIEGDLPGADALIALMAQDKKVAGGVLAFILARDIGDAFVTRDVPLETIQTVLNDALLER